LSVTASVIDVQWTGGTLDPGYRIRVRHVGLRDVGTTGQHGE